MPASLIKYKKRERIIKIAHVFPEKVLIERYF